MGQEEKKSVIVVRAAYRVRTREYSRLVKFDTKRLPSGCWILQIIQELEARSGVRPEVHSDLIMFQWSLQLIIENEEGRSILCHPAQKIGRIEIRKLFFLFEQILTQSQKWKTSVKNRMSTYFRKYIFDFAQSLPFRESITRQTVRFQSSMYISSLPRAMISDLEHSGDGKELTAPLGALQHGSIQELHDNAQSRINSDLQRIISACIEELSFWKSIRVRLMDLSSMTFSRAELAMAHRVVQVGYSKSTVNKFIETVAPERRLALYARIALDMNSAAMLQAREKFPGIEDLITNVLGISKHQASGTYPRWILFLPTRIISNELIAAFVLLLCYTGWNAHSLVGLTADKITIGDKTARLTESSQVEIQGFKSKVDDDTPTAVLDSTYPSGVYAVELLMWNLRQLRALKIVTLDEKRIWFSYSKVSEFPYKEQYIGFQNSLDVFIGKYALPRFSLDQIRPQVLMAEYLRTRGIDDTRRVAGHKSITTTGRYLEQEFFRRMNSSINLEFQRRLEATVHFRMKERAPEFATTIDNKYVDEKLLVPIGDGSSCSDPISPPYESYLDGELCKGRLCHVGDGCPNRRISITRERIEELVRKRIYYANNWGRLLNENPDAFEKFHADKILFTIGLYDFVSASRYSHVLREIERNVAEGV